MSTFSHLAAMPQHRPYGADKPTCVQEGVLYATHHHHHHPHPAKSRSTDPDFAAQYNPILAGIAQITKEAKQGDVQAILLLPRIAEFLSLRTGPNPEVNPGVPAAVGLPGFPPEMTTNDIAGQVGLQILTNLAHRGLAAGDCEQADGIAQKLMKVLDRAFDKDADSQAGIIAIFRVAHTAGEALLAICPDFEKFLRAHGVPSAATQAKRQVTTDKTAALLYDYMTFRTGLEGMVHELTVEYYREHLDKGFKGFFGVTFGPDGALKADVQQPELFREWKKGVSQ